MKINEYEKQLTPEEVRLGAHRDIIGGMWEEIGVLQADFLIAQGLRPDMRFLDVGCGSLRGGVHFIKYLNAGNYYGMDMNQSLIDAGYNVELPKAGLQEKLPLENLLCDDKFLATKFDMKFDMALALSVFTHLPLNHIRLCLIALADAMRAGASFYATVFVCPDSDAWEQTVVHEPGGIVTYPAKDPYHYKVSDFEWLVSELPWSFEYIGDWNHPRNQKVIRFSRS